MKERDELIDQLESEKRIVEKNKEWAEKAENDALHKRDELQK